jgi:hypothetical protein
MVQYYQMDFICQVISAQKAVLEMHHNEYTGVDQTQITSNSLPVPAAKPTKLTRQIKFDDAMRRLVKLPPPPTGKKAKRKVRGKKRR